MRALRVATALIALAAAGACGSADREDRSTPRSTETPAVSPRPAATGSAVPATPVVVGPEAVAGWWDGRSWVSAEGRLAEIPVAGGETYRLVRLSDEIRTARGSGAIEGCEIVPGAARIEIAGLARQAGRDPPPIAVSHVDNPRPRPVEQLDPGAAVYREAAAALLKQRGVDGSQAEVVQVVEADMDGDGGNEVVVVAERIVDENLFAGVGDYSLVFLRRAAGETVTTAVVEESVPDPKPGQTPFVMSHRISAVADLNGDGRMELALSSRYYEGAGVGFYELKQDGSMAKVLNSACGA